MCGGTGTGSAGGRDSSDILAEKQKAGCMEG